jgi:hypothetical protein
MASQKQKGFAKSVMQGMSKAKAYRKHYACKNMSVKAIRVEATRLYKTPTVALIIQKLEETLQKRHDVTVESLCKELDEAIDIARKSKHSSAMTSAVLGKAKLHGLLRDDKTIKFKRLDDMNEGEILETLGGEPSKKELSEAIVGEKVSKA